MILSQKYDVNQSCLSGCCLPNMCSHAGAWERAIYTAGRISNLVPMLPTRIPKAGVPKCGCCLVSWNFWRCLSVAYGQCVISVSLAVYGKGILPDAVKSMLSLDQCHATLCLEYLCFPVLDGAGPAVVAKVINRWGCGWDQPPRKSTSKKQYWCYHDIRTDSKPLQVGLTG